MTTPPPETIIPTIVPASWTCPAMMRHSQFLLACLMTAVSTVASSAEDPTATPEQLEFFEKQIRPVLIEHCWECHGSKKQQAGLRLDSRAASLKGNESGPALKPGDVAGSRLVKVLAYSDDDIQMPPSGKLSPEIIAALTKWVEMGAPWPADTATNPSGSANARAEHWSFQPRQHVSPPAVGELSRAANPIDAFIIDRLRQKGLELSPPADRATWLRRVTLNLWGLPPSYDEIQEFVADSRPEAPELMIDRLLASPQYGERWARHWLDVARYADTKGYVFTAEPRFPYAYTYRDYVIGAFNEDKPYDRFVREQLAADQLGLPANAPELAAMGFLTVGRRFLNNEHDIIDDRIDVVSRGLMGLTVGCARCHDHKYDPIPTADYYSLYGVFASTVEPNDLPLIGEPSANVDYEKFLVELKKRQDAITNYEQETLAKISQELREKVQTYLEYATKPEARSPREAAKALTTGDPRPSVVRRWRKFLDERSKQPDPIFGPWHELANLEPEAFVQRWNEMKPRWEPGGENARPLNPRLRQRLLDQPAANMAELAARYGDLFREIDAQWRELLKQNAQATALPEAAVEELRQVLHAAGTPTVLTTEDTRGIYNRAERDKQRNLQKQVENLQATSPGAPPRAMIVVDKDQPVDPHVLIRGNPGRPGPRVPRQFLEVVAGTERKPFVKKSGRSELADAIVDPANPLTARVIVNRLWQHHFGRGLVGTPSDFGIRGEAPTHPELLDYLAQELIDSGWSLKHIQRLIVTSAVFGQSSVDNSAAREVDPENHLLWRMPRRRLELEAMRDGWLAVSGRLDTVLGGRPFDNLTEPNGTRRTIYGLINRNDLPGVFRVFDFADPDASAPARPQTTVPQQALFALNAPFVIAQARRLADESAAQPDDSQRTAWLFQHVLGREPDSSERELAIQYVRTAKPDEPLPPWGQLAQALLLTNEFLFVD